MIEDESKPFTLFDGTAYLDRAGQVINRDPAADPEDDGTDQGSAWLAGNNVVANLGTLEAGHAARHRRHRRLARGEANHRHLHAAALEHQRGLQPELLARLTPERRSILDPVPSRLPPA